MSIIRTIINRLFRCHCQRGSVEIILPSVSADGAVIDAVATDAGIIHVGHISEKELEETRLKWQALYGERDSNGHYHLR